MTGRYVRWRTAPPVARGVPSKEEKTILVDLPMYAQLSKKSYQQSAIEFLAKESQVPIDEVARLYEDKRAELEAGARLTGFVSIFAIRKVREMLRQRSIGKRPPT